MVGFFFLFCIEKLSWKCDTNSGLALYDSIDFELWRDILWNFHASNSAILRRMRLKPLVSVFGFLKVTDLLIVCGSK